MNIPVLSLIRDPNWFPATRKLARWIEGEIQHIGWMVGSVVVNTGAAAKFIARGKLKPKHLVEQAAFVGWDTLGIALVMTATCGMVIALQLAKEMVKQGAINYVGALVSMALLREMAPVMTGFAVLSMAGSAFAAELSTMQITNQVEALRVLHIHPIRYLIVPRVVAAILVLPLMTMLTATAGILGGMGVAYAIAEVPFSTYLDSVWNHTEVKDILAALLKGGVFGYLIALFATTIGLNTKGGAKEVGESTTRAVVWCFVTMAIFDYILTYTIYGAD